MKKFCFLFFIVMITSISLFAQRQGLSIGGNVYFPLGDWANIASAGYGGSVSYEHPLERNIAGVIYSGYTYFGGDSEGSSWTMVPLVAGAKFYLSPELDWYIAALLGVNFVTAKITVAQSEISASSTEFSGNVNFGYEVKTSETGAMDISAGFVYINQLSYFGARLAYIFKL